MKINEKTKIILRLHKTDNNRGLAIYNPFFEQSDINAIYVLRFNETPKPLVEGMRLLNIDGAIPAGFEKDPNFIDLLDGLTPEAEKIGRVGVVFHENGKLIGHYQGGIGLYNSITSKYGELSDKKIVLLGAGTVARGFLLEIEKRNIDCQITLINRTKDRAENVKTEFDNLDIDINDFEELLDLDGDVFIDTTDVGSPWNKGDDIKYTKEFVSNFKFIADVTFVPIEPPLIQMANASGIDNAPGHRMFLYQAEECMKRILGEQEYDLGLYSKLMLKDFKVNWS